MGYGNFFNTIYVVGWIHFEQDAFVIMAFSFLSSHALYLSNLNAYAMEWSAMPIRSSQLI